MSAPRVAMPAPPAEGRDRPATTIAPSILSADFARLADECASIVAQGADWLHVDVMDGHFCPNLTLGAPIVASLRKHTPAFLDCHLMVTDPAFWVNDFAKAGADSFCFHLEAAATAGSAAAANPAAALAALSPTAALPAVTQLCDAVRAAGMHVGIALKPDTPVDLVYPYVDAGLVDMVLVMTVQPGFGGQKCIMDAFAKVKALRGRSPTLHIQVDGGISPGATIEAAAAAGANVIVAGSAVFGVKDPREAIAMLRSAVDGAAAVKAC